MELFPPVYCPCSFNAPVRHHCVVLNCWMLCHLYPDRLLHFMILLDRSSHSKNTDFDVVVQSMEYQKWAVWVHKAAAVREDALASWCQGVEALLAEFCPSREVERNQTSSPAVSCTTPAQGSLWCFVCLCSVASETVKWGRHMCILHIKWEFRPHHPKQTIWDMQVAKCPN